MSRYINKTRIQRYTHILFTISVHNDPINKFWHNKNNFEKTTHNRRKIKTYYLVKYNKRRYIDIWIESPTLRKWIDVLTIELYFAHKCKWSWSRRRGGPQWLVFSMGERKRRAYGACKVVKRGQRDLPNHKLNHANPSI